MTGNTPLSPTELKRLHRDWRRTVEVDLSVVLDGVQNPYNMGAIFRSAAAYRVSELILVPPSVEPDHPKVSKTALGSQKLVPASTADTGPQAVARQAAAGVVTVALELTASSVPLFDLALPPAVCLVVGHEERGVHRDTLAAVDHVAYVPQLGKIGSLNVAHSLTVALYEMTRQQAVARRHDGGVNS